MKDTHNLKFLRKIAPNETYQSIKEITYDQVLFIITKNTLVNISKPNGIIHYINGLIYYHLCRQKKCIL